MNTLFATFFKKQLELILSAAGLSLQDIAKQAAENSNRTVMDASNTIEHDKQVILAAQGRIDDCKKALKQSNKVLGLVSKFI